MTMDIAKFAIDTRAVCVQDIGINERNREFLELVNPSYFLYVADTHVNNLDGENAQAAALSLRAAYSHGLEALFAFLAAMIQAPECVYGWLDRYKTGELMSLVAKIRTGEKILTRLRASSVGWSLLSDLVHENLALPDHGGAIAIKAGFAGLWDRLSNDFLSPDMHHEYNCIKHGFRAKSGGFSIRMGPEDVQGVVCPPEKMSNLGGSKFGSRIFALERIADSNSSNFRSRRKFRNWSPVNFSNALHLISMSVNNIVGRLRVHAGATPTSVQYRYPADLSAFDSPWSKTPPVLASILDYSVDESAYSLLSKEEILTSYQREEDKS